MGYTPEQLSELSNTEIPSLRKRIDNLEDDVEILTEIIESLIDSLKSFTRGV